MGIWKLLRVIRDIIMVIIMIPFVILAALIFFLGVVMYYPRWLVERDRNKRKYQ